MSEERVQLYETSEKVRHFEIVFGGNGLARLYCEVFEDAEGRPQSTCRLHFDGDIRREVMRAVLDQVTSTVLSTLPRGVCIVYRGHILSSFDYGAAPAKA